MIQKLHSDVYLENEARAPALAAGVSGLAPASRLTLLAGLRIWNEHSNASSTDMTAPALSNSPQ